MPKRKSREREFAGILVYGGWWYPGMSKGVRIILSCQFSPPIVLYDCAETNPPMKPKRTYRMIMTVVNAPRLLGDKNPSKAKTTINGLFPQNQSAE